MSNKPVKELRNGPFRLSIWEHVKTGDTGYDYLEFSIRFEKQIKKDGEYKLTNYIFPNELLEFEWLLTAGYDWCQQRSSAFRAAQKEQQADQDEANYTDANKY